MNLEENEWLALSFDTKFKIIDVHEEEDSWVEANGNKEPESGWAGHASLQAGLHGGSSEVQQVGLQRGFGKIREVDGGVWIDLRIVQDMHYSHSCNN